MKIIKDNSRMAVMAEKLKEMLKSSKDSTHLDKFVNKRTISSLLSLLLYRLDEDIHEILKA